MVRPFDETGDFRDAQVLITGGMGFIGSNLAIALVRLGARVTIADATIEGLGGNPFNIEPIRECVSVHDADIRDSGAMNSMVQDKDYIFHLAGQVDHVRGVLDSPFDDIDMNIKGTAVLLEAARRQNPKARLIYTGTRGQYGRPESLPVAEDAPLRPVGVHDVTNLAAEKLIESYNLMFDLRCVLLRLSNVYGPRAQMRHSRNGVVNWFIRLAMENRPIPLFGDGRILRDFLYVDDCVEAIIACAASEAACGRVFNVGGAGPASFLQLADAICRAAGQGSWEFAPFSPERLALEPGDFYSDITRIRTMVGWTPRVGLEEGLARTVDYYRDHARHYWTMDKKPGLRSVQASSLVRQAS